jgi:hypothetical protein
MADQISTEFSLNVGEIPNSPGFKVSARLGLGTSNSANIRSTFRDKTGGDLEALSFYVVVVARTTEGAEDLRSVIQRTIDRFSTPEGQNEPGFSRLKRLLATSDEQEFEGEPKFTFSVAVHDVHVIVKARPIAQMREQAEAQLEMVSGLAGDVLQRDNEVYAEFDMGKVFSELVQSQNWILDAFDSIALKLWIHLHPQLFSDLSNLASNLGAPEQVLMGLGSAGLFHAASLNFNFRSSSELPADFKEGLGRLSAKAGDPNFHREIPENVKKFLKHFAENGSGNMHIFAAAHTAALFVDLHLPGIAKFLAE